MPTPTPTAERAVADDPAADDRALRPELAGLLASVRGRLRRYVLLRGLAVLVLTTVGVFWAALWLDDAWFAATRLELPAWLRVGFDGLAAGLLLAVAGLWIVGRLFVAAKPRDLALAVERRFPDLRGRLVLAVERADDPGLAAAESPFTAALADRAARGAADRVRALAPGELFDTAPLRRTLALAGVLGLGTVAFGLWQGGAVRRLSDAYLELAEVYRVRTTALTVAALLPPGEEVKPLTPGEPHRHPRGADLTLLIGVPSGERPGGGPWRPPEQVTVTRETAGGATGRSFALPDGPGRFRFALDEVRDGMTIRLAGGDYVDRTPYVIEAVDPPRPRRVTLSSLYPAYTRRNAVNAAGDPLPEVSPVRGAKATIPVGTQFDLILEANKPLADARVTVDGDAVPATVERNGGETDGGEPIVRVPLAMLPPEPPEPPEPDATAEPAAVVPVPTGAVGVRPGARVTIELEDADGIRSQSPVRLVLAGRVDEPPAVRVEPVGVSDALTRTAAVPFVGTIEDDYGLASARFLYRISGGESDAPIDPAGSPESEAPGDGEAPGEPEEEDAGVVSDWQERRFRVRPRGLPERFDVGDPDPAVTIDRDAERFVIAGLDLKVGQTLSLVVAAEDANDLTGPGEGRGPERSFQIVTPEELLARLFDREVNLRRVFERSLEEVVAVGDDLALLGDDAAANDVRRTAGLAAAELSQNAGQAEAVRSGFQALLAERANNGVLKSAERERLEGKILLPLTAITEDLFPEADRAAGALRVAAEQGVAAPERAAAVRRARLAADRLAAEMAEVLAQMETLAGFREVEREFAQLLRVQEELLDRTRQEQKSDLIDGLFE